MSIETKVLNHCLVVHIIGDIDHHNADAMRDEIDRALQESQVRHLIFDFQSVTFMDSSGIGMIIGRYRQLAYGGGKVMAVNIPKDVRRLFDMAGLPKIVNCYDTVDQATQSL